MTFIIDSYSEANKDNSTAIHSGTNTRVGQAFKAPLSGSLIQAKFYLLRVGTLATNVYAVLYGCAGTPGTDGKGTGSVLATSDAVAASSISSLGFNLVTFTFSGADIYSVIKDSNYCILAEHTGGDATHYIDVGIDNVGETHAGNCTVYDPTIWDYWVGTDVCFYAISSEPTFDALLIAGD